MSNQPPLKPTSTFDDEAQAQQTGIITEFIDLLKHNKKWWLLPILIVLLGVGVLIVLGGTAAAPFIYTRW